MNALLDIENLCKRFGATRALDNVSLHIENAAAIGLVGKNGAGKSTLLSILSGALRADSGSLHILGESSATIARSGKLSILPQDANFRDGIPVYQQLLLFARLQGLQGNRAAEAVNDLLSRLGDSDFVRKPPSAMSYGQRKKLGILQAFLGNPKLVILDEPTAGLDPVVANDVRHLIQHLSADCSFIISSHNLYEIEDICSSVIILDRGKLIANKPIAELVRSRNQLKFTLASRARDSLLAELRALPGMTSVTRDEFAAEKLSLELEMEAPADTQLKAQKLLVDNGHMIVEFNYGKALIEGIMDLVDDSHAD